MPYMCRIPNMQGLRNLNIYSKAEAIVLIFGHTTASSNAIILSELFYDKNSGGIGRRDFGATNLFTAQTATSGLTQFMVLTFSEKWFQGCIISNEELDYSTN